MKYKLKQRPIYAIRFFGDKWDESAPPGFHEKVNLLHCVSGDRFYFGNQNGGLELVKDGDWLIKHEHGAFDVLSNSLFEAMYESDTQLE